jgi:two-component system sensor histidine kinase AlgZ
MPKLRRGENGLAPSPDTMLRPADESIRQRPSALERGLDAADRPTATTLDTFSKTRSTTVASTHTLLSMPDWCNSGVAVRVILGWNLIGMAVALAISTDFANWSAASLRFALTLEPTLIGSLLIACVARPVLMKMVEPLQIAVVLLIPAALLAAYETALGPLLAVSGELVWRDAILAAAAAAATLYWARLRGQSYLPALAEARLAALQSRIRPHFLFNSLNAVLGLIRSDARRAETILEDLADLFRVLMRDHHQRVPLDEEIALCRKYLDIESLRLGSRLMVEMQIDERATSALVPLLLLQPLVENAVLHGIEPAAEAGLVKIDVERRGNQVAVTISNPWHGEQVRTGHHMGLSNVRQRLELLHDLEARLETRLEDGRFVLVMTLPFTKSGGEANR